MRGQRNATSPLLGRPIRHKGKYLAESYLRFRERQIRIQPYDAPVGGVHKTVTVLTTLRSVDSWRVDRGTPRVYPLSLGDRVSPWRVTLNLPPRMQRVRRARLRETILCDWYGRLRQRLFCHLRQNREKHQVPRVAAVVSEGILVEIALQVFLPHRVVPAADSSFHQRPKSFNRIGMHVAHDVDLGGMADALMTVLLFHAADAVIAVVL